MNKFYWCYITNIPSSYYGYGYWCKIMADTPKQAYKNGSDWLVIGRPITQSDDILGTLEGIFNKIYNS